MSHRRRAGPCYPGPRGCVPGVIKRVVRALSDRFGVPRGWVVAGFVLGLVFAPVLTVLLFLGAWYWLHHPAEVEATLDRVVTAARRGYDGMRHRAAAPSAATRDDDEPPDLAALRREFEALERRARGMEAYVASEEFSLEREIGRMRNRPAG